MSLCSGINSLFGRIPQGTPLGWASVCGSLRTVNPISLCCSVTRCPIPFESVSGLSSLGCVRPHLGYFHGQPFFVFPSHPFHFCKAASHWSPLFLAKGLSTSLIFSENLLLVLLIFPVVLQLPTWFFCALVCYRLPSACSERTLLSFSELLKADD